MTKKVTLSPAFSRGLIEAAVKLARYCSHITLSPAFSRGLIEASRAAACCCLQDSLSPAISRGLIEADSFFLMGMTPFLVPTLCVGTHPGMLRVLSCPL